MGVTLADGAGAWWWGRAPWTACGSSFGARLCSLVLPPVPKEGALGLACVVLSMLPGEHLTVLFLEPGCMSSPPPAAVWLAAERLVPALLLESEGSAADAVGAVHRCSLRFSVALRPPGVPTLDKPLQAARYHSSVVWGGGGFPSGD